MERDHEQERSEAEPATAARALAAAPASLESPAGVLALQRAVGNRSVSALVLARQTPTADAGVRDAAAPPPGQPAQPPAPPPRIHRVFIMGTDPPDNHGRATHGFYWAARQYFTANPPQPGAVVLSASSLADVQSQLAAAATGNARIGHVYLVSHATPMGLNFPLNAADPDHRIGTGELRTNAPQLGAAAVATGRYDADSHIHVRGCNVGRNREFMELLNQSFGGLGTAEGPMHRMHYWQDARGPRAGQPSEGVSEYYVTFLPPAQTRSQQDLADAFEAKYSALGLGSARWLQIVQAANPQPRTVDRAVMNITPGAQETDDQLISGSRAEFNDRDEYDWTVNRQTNQVRIAQIRYDIPRERVEGPAPRAAPAVGGTDYSAFYLRVGPNPLPAPQRPAATTSP